MTLISSKNEIHSAVLKGMTNVLQEGKSQPRLDILTWIPGQAGSAELQQRLSGYRGLIVAVGTSATQAVFEAKTQNPLLSVLVPESAYRQLFDTAIANGRHGTTSAIFLNQPIERQITLARILLPRVETAGLLVGPRLKRREAELRAAAESQGLRLHMESTTSKQDTAEAIKRLLHSSKLIFALHDPVALTPVTAKWLLYMAYQRSIPVIGFSRAYLKAGAVASVFSTPEQIGRQAGERVLHWLETGSTDLGDPQYPRYYSIEFNQPVGESLEIRFPDKDEVIHRMAELLGDP